MKNAILEALKKASIDQYEIYSMQSTSVSCETFRDGINSDSSSTGGGICLRVIVDGKMGYASTESMDVNDAALLVERAVDNARTIDSESPAVLYDGKGTYQKKTCTAEELSSVADIRKHALDIASSLYRKSDMVSDGTAAEIDQEKVSISIVNSNGVDVTNEVSATVLAASAVVQKDGLLKNSWSAEVAPQLEKMDLTDCVDDAISQFGAGHVKSGKYTVVFEAKTMAQILSTFSPVFSGKAAHLGLSLLKGKENQKIASDIVTICDAPLYEGSCLQTPFDGEGVPTCNRKVVENGKLNTLLYDLSTAKLCGKESTGNGMKGSYASPVSIEPYHFYIENGDKSLETLFKEMKDGIYVTMMKGFHAGASATTGDFSIESAGFVVKDGKKCGPVEEFTVAGNFYELLKSISGIANDLKFGLPEGMFTRFGSPAVRVENLAVAGE